VTKKCNDFKVLSARKTERSQCKEIKVSDSHANGLIEEKDNGKKKFIITVFIFHFMRHILFSENTRSEHNNNNTFFETEKKNLIFLDSLLELSEGDGGLCDQDIRDEVDAFMFGVSLEA
jgi:hypothetical protein